MSTLLVTALVAGNFKPATIVKVGIVVHLKQPRVFLEGSLGIFDVVIGVGTLYVGFAYGWI